MTIYNSRNLTTVSTPYDFEVNESSLTSISSEHLLFRTYNIYYAIGHFLILVVILTPGLLINMKFLNNIKHEERKVKGKKEKGKWRKH